MISAVGYMRLGVEAIGAAVIGIGAVSTVFLFARSLLAPGEYSTWRSYRKLCISRGRVDSG